MRGLSNTMLGVQTYCFTYPSVDDLLRVLRNAVMNGEADFLDIHDRQGLRISGMSYIDDFTLITPLDLSLVSRIWPEKVNMLFDFVRGMIQAVHTEKQKEIVEMAGYIQVG